ncbi:golgi uridine diphosphate-N- acetylglucosamine transporter, partial [Linderina macrospora]
MGVFLAAMLGLYQETTYKKYGKHWQEGLFYNHVLALPMFLFFRNDILAQMRALSVSRPVNLAALPVVGPLCPNISVPSLWVSLVANILSQLVCVSGVHRLTSMSSSLTLNVVLNLRKLVSLVLSVVLFKNSVNAGMVAGCLMVFVGTFAYSQTNQLLPPKQQSAVKSDSGSEVVVASAMDQPKTPALKQVNRPSTQK